MLKKVISPFQKVLLKRRLCVGCTYPLDKITKRVDFSPKEVVVQCKCRRRFIFDKETQSYRRMSLQEEQEFLTNLSK